MIRKTLCIAMTILIVPLTVSGPFGQQFSDKSTVIGTPHDTDAGGNGCINCHVPHQLDPKGRTLLWNPDFTTLVFGIYDSGTMDSTAVEVGDATYSGLNPPIGAKSRTVLCLSCHDGTTTTALIAAGSQWDIGSLTDSDGLRNDHPVNMAFDPVADPGLNTIASVQATNVRLFPEGSNETVQCASCHDPHGAAPLTSFYLRVSNTNSGLCVTCHM